MRNIFSLSTFATALLTVVLVFCGIALYGMFSSASLTFGSNEFNRSFSVDGVGKVEVTPNEFTTTVTVLEMGTTQEAAQQAGNAKQTEVMQLLSSLGIKESDIKTTQYQISPYYDYSEDTEPKPTAYQFTQSTTITTQNKEIMQKALDDLTPIGVNVGGMDFDIDTEEFEGEATQKAIENAKLKAEQLAQAGGFKVGRILSISQYTDQGGPEPYPIEMRSSLPGAGKDTSVISPGTNEVVSRVTITYSIR